jgi:hypothetical protein
LISFAAPADRWASERTSPATTAKPRPCSPARAASTAAFSARIFVWKAMPSIRPMMSTMRVAEPLIWPIVAPTCCTAAPPRPATLDASPTRPSARSALSVLLPALAATCARLAAVCSRLAACDSVRRARSWLPARCRAWRIDRADVGAHVADDGRQVDVQLAQRQQQAADFVVAAARGGRDRSPPASAYTASSARRSGRHDGPLQLGPGQQRQHRAGAAPAGASPMPSTPASTSQQRRCAPSIRPRRRPSGRLRRLQQARPPAGADDGAAADRQALRPPSRKAR